MSDQSIERPAHRLKPMAERALTAAANPHDPAPTGGARKLRTYHKRSGKTQLKPAADAGGPVNAQVSSSEKAPWQKSIFDF